MIETERKIIRRSENFVVLIKVRACKFACEATDISCNIYSTVRLVMFSYLLESLDGLSSWTVRDPAHLFISFSWSPHPWWRSILHMTMLASCAACSPDLRASRKYIPSSNWQSPPRALVLSSIVRSFYYVTRPTMLRYRCRCRSRRWPRGDCSNALYVVHNVFDVIQESACASSA